MKKTINIRIGKGSISHNNRKFVAKNVDEKRVKGCTKMYNVRACTSSVRPVPSGEAFCRAVWQAPCTPCTPFWALRLYFFQLWILKERLL